MAINRSSDQECHEATCAFAAHYGPELEPPAPPRRKKRRRPCAQQAQEETSAEMPSPLNDLLLVAEWMKNTSKPPCHQGRSEPAALHDHRSYCMPEDAALAKSLMQGLKDMVHHQSELLLNLQGALEANQKACQALQEEKWPVISDLRERLSHLEAENRNLLCERDQMESTVHQLQEELDASGATVLFLGKQLRGQQKAQALHGAFSLENVKNNAKWLRFYTSFDQYSRFSAFLDFLLEGSGEGQEGLESGPHSALSPANQLFLVLVRLRLGLLLQDLAFRFHISESTASRYWLSWTEFMERRLRQIPVTYSQHYIDAFKPQLHIRHCDVSLVALDCTEFYFEAQGRPRGKGDATQGPKNRYSMHGYTLAAPSGFLTFSAGTGEELPPLPPFLEMGHVDLTAQQEAMKRHVLSLRSLVDKVLSFRFLRVVHPQNMEGQVRRAWTISCYLATLLHEPMGLA